MKKIIMAVVIMGIAGGVYAAEFGDLAVKAADLKAAAAAESCTIKPDFANSGVAPVAPDTGKPGVQIDQSTNLPHMDMGYFKKSSEDICYGAYYAASPSHSCYELTGDAQAICYGMYYATSTSHSCYELTGDAQAICYGLYYADSPSRSCYELTGDAKAICYGRYYADSPNRSCYELEGDARTICYGMYYAASPSHNCYELRAGSGFHS